MNVRLLIMFGLMIQLLTGHAQSACSAPCTDVTVTTQSDSACGGCCEDMESQRPTEPRDCPRDACPLCLTTGSDPNELAVLPLREREAFFETPVPLAWSVLIDDENIRRSLMPRRMHDPPPVLLRREATRTGRWLL